MKTKYSQFIILKENEMSWEEQMELKRKLDKIKIEKSWNDKWEDLPRPTNDEIYEYISTLSIKEVIEFCNRYFGIIDREKFYPNEEEIKNYLNQFSTDKQETLINYLGLPAHYNDIKKEKKTGTLTSKMTGISREDLPEESQEKYDTVMWITDNVRKYGGYITMGDLEADSSPVYSSEGNSIDLIEILTSDNVSVTPYTGYNHSTALDEYDVEYFELELDTLKEIKTLLENAIKFDLLEEDV